MTTETFKNDIQAGIKAAMIAKDTIKLETYRSINNAIGLFEKNADNLGKSFDPIAIVTSLAKQRQQSIEGFVKGGNEEAAEKERQELAILNTFLPQKMTDADLILALNEVIMEMTPVPTIKEMGKIVAAFKAKYPGQDMGKVTGFIKTVLPA